MKKKLFACLLMVLLLLQASIFVAIAQQSEISLNTQESTYDYFGNAYEIDIESGEFSVSFKNEVYAQNYLVFYLYSPTNANISIKAFDEIDYGAEMNFSLNAGETKLVTLPTLGFSRLIGLAGESNSEYLIISGIKTSESIASPKSFYMPSIAFCYQKSYTADYVEINYLIRSANQVQSVEFICENALTQNTNSIIAERKEQDYTLTVRVIDKAENQQTLTFVIPKIGEIASEFELTGGTVKGVVEDTTFARGAKVYTLTTNANSGIEFELFTDAVDLTIITQNGEIKGFCPQICYTVMAKSNQITSH